MWWRWIVVIICGVLILACGISTLIEWIQGKTGPLGPKPENWWGCGVFTIILLVILYFVGKKLF
ncbi:hypothetical protein ACFL1T_03680 [Chlamydiota bacterium]